MGDKKLEWMYKSSSRVDPEEYLLGRAIDKNYENPSTSHNGVDKDILPTSIFAGSNSNVQVDVLRKIKEDPLEQIKQKEIEVRKQLLKNPVKLKKIQNLLKAKEEKKVRKDAKAKKRKGGEKEIDDILTEKYMQLISKYGAKHLIELTKSDDASSDESEPKKKKKTKKRKSEKSENSSSSEDQKDGKRGKSGRRKDEDKEQSLRKTGKVPHTVRTTGRKNASSSEEDDRRQRKRRTRERNDEEPARKRDADSRPSKRSSGREEDPKRRQRRSSTSSSDGSERKDVPSYPNKARKNEYDYSSDEDKSAFKKSYGLVLPKGVEPKARSAVRPEVKKQEYPSGKGRYKRSQPSKLTEEEKEAKLKEMLMNAQWRNEERKNNIARYNRQAKKEQDEEQTYDDDFMRKQLAKSGAKSVADRIKSNINNVQRSKFAMDQHFAKRT